MKTKIISIIVVSLFIFCSQTETRDNVSKEMVEGSLLFTPKSDSLLIFWDESSTSQDTIVEYQVLFHTQSDTNWKLLKNVEKSNSPRVIVSRSEVPLNETIFFFGVKNVSKSGKTSKLHSTSDPTAYSKNLTIHWPIKK